MPRTRGDGPPVPPAVEQLQRSPRRRGDESMTELKFTYNDAWAKAVQDAVAQHLLTHCRIAGSVARSLLLRDQYPWASGLPILGACHDVGKLSAPFLSQNEAWMAEFGLANLTERWRRSKIRHEVFTQAVVSEILEGRTLSPHRGDVPERAVSTLAAQILGAHHGVWQAADLGELDLKEWRVFFKTERQQLVELLEAEFGRLPQETFSDTRARYLAGAVAVCDWIASNPEFFPYHDHYSPELCSQLATEVVDRIGLIPKPFVSGLTFEQALGFTANAMQEAIDTLPLDRGLYLIEADTGCGKTESALYFAYRLITAGVCRGLYFALPT